MTSDRPPLRVTLVGGADALWPVAALLAENLPPGSELTLVEDSAAPPASAGLCIAADHPYLQALGLTADVLAAQCGATQGLGVDLIGWQGDATRFFSARSGSLPLINGVALHHILLRAAMTYEEPGRLGHLYAPFRFAARAAMAGRFAEVCDDPQSPLRLLGRTVQLERSAFTALLRQRCAEAGFAQLAARPVHAECDGTTGAIASVRLDNGDDLSADLFVDVSGVLSALCKKHSDPARQDLTKGIAFDRIMADARPITAPSAPMHATAHALPGGLLMQTPCHAGARTDLMFRSSDMTDDEAQALVSAEGPSRPFAASLMREPWTANLVRMGDAAGSLGPFRSADALMLFEPALRFVQCLPVGQDMLIESAEYNREIALSMEEIRDFVLLPLLLNTREEAGWQIMRAAVPPDSLRLRLGEFRRRGGFPSYDTGLFDDQSWIELLIGFGVVPERFDPLTGAFDMQRTAPVLGALASTFNDTLEAMPLHRAV